MSKLIEFKKKLINKYLIFYKIYLLKRYLYYYKFIILPDKVYANYFYKKKAGHKINFKNPVEFDEKLWCLKLYDKNPLKRTCTDKILVRDYVKKCGLKHILIEKYGEYKSFKEINFNNLKSPCFIKWNHTSGCNCIYDRGKDFNYNYYKAFFNFWEHLDYYYDGREWNYRGINRKIIIEKVIRDKNGNLPLDYKFFCFNGKVEILTLDIGVANEKGEHASEYYRNIYDRDFNLLPYKETRDNSPEPFEKPDNFDLMIKYAEILSKPFIHCRVDLYNVDGQIYFGEITFHHGGGGATISILNLVRSWAV